MSLESPPPVQIVRLQLPQARPLWSYLILAVHVLIFIAGQLVGHNLVLALGAKINEAIVAGEVWRLATAMFLHVDLIHLAFNGYALFNFGPLVERNYGRLRFLIAYGLAGLAGSAFSFLLSPRPSVGASGAIFGLIGVVGAFYFLYRRQLVAGQSRLLNIVGIAFYNLLYGVVTPAIDNWAHIGGLLAGLALGWALAPLYRVRQSDPWMPPRLEDQSSFQRQAFGVVLVSAVIALVILGGMLRWR